MDTFAKQAQAAYAADAAYCAAAEEMGEAPVYTATRRLQLPWHRAASKQAAPAAPATRAG
jgi:predicted nucleic acid-binding protein